MPIVEEFIADFGVIGNHGSTLFVRTDLDAPRRKVIAIDPLLRIGRAGWKTVVPEAQHPLEEAAAAGGKIVAGYLVDVTSRVEVYSLDGAKEGELALPGVGTARGLSGREDGDELFYQFTSQLTPATVYRYDLKRGKSKMAVGKNLLEYLRLFGRARG